MRKTKFILMIAAILTAVLCFLKPKTVNGQCTGTGFLSPAVVASVSSINNEWSNPNNVKSEDGNVASSDALVLGDKSEQLQVSDFNFNIPASATVCGIEVKIKKMAAGVLQNVTDDSVMVLKSGAIVGSNSADPGVWNASLTTKLYGSNNNAWGTTWSVAQVNDSSFGISTASKLNGITALPSARIDYIGIQVYYSLPLLIELNQFSIESLTNSNLISWTFASTLKTNTSELQRMRSDNTWETLSEWSVDHNNLEFSYEDNTFQKGSNYYRIKGTSFDGVIDYSIIKSVSNHEDAPNDFNFEVYPNPSSGSISISFDNEDYNVETVRIIDFQGKTISEIDVNHSSNPFVNYSFKDTPNGIYYIEVKTHSGVTAIRKKIIMNR